jgi:hypothetical protein
MRPRKRNCAEVGQSDFRIEGSVNPNQGAVRSGAGVLSSSSQMLVVTDIAHTPSNDTSQAERSPRSPNSIHALLVAVDQGPDVHALAKELPEDTERLAFENTSKSTTYQRDESLTSKVPNESHMHSCSEELVDRRIQEWEVRPNTNNTDDQHHLHGETSEYQLPGCDDLSTLALDLAMWAEFPINPYISANA